jgi:hypothetical protein
MLAFSKILKSVTKQVIADEMLASAKGWIFSRSQAVLHTHLCAKLGTKESPG